MEDITDADYMHTKIVCKNFEINIFGEYYDFYVEIDTLLLVDVFENFRNMCIKVYELKTSFSPCISMTSSFKED